MPSPNHLRGPSDSELHSVSCVSAGDCTAVGYSSSSNGSLRTLIESWNGTSWSIVASPNKGASDNVLLGGSCVSGSACTAVGYYADGSGLDRTLIESWNGTSWSIVASPNNGTSDNLLLGVSCVSASACTAGGYSIVSGLSRTLTESWNGTAWSIVASPNKGPSHNLLYAVSCVSPSVCTAVGAYVDTAGVQRTLVESWNGTSWSVVASPSNGTGANYLFSVSCLSATACTAVGGFLTSSGVERTLVESWNGSTWSILASPENGTDHNYLLGVSCRSASACTAVGAYFNDSKGLTQTLVESWNGSTWSIVASPNHRGSSLSGVSCVSASVCTTAGSYADRRRTLIESWNGTTWSIVSSPNPFETVSDVLTGVSCVSPTRCMAVGSSFDASGVHDTLIESWNGTSWSIVASPNRGISGSLSGVSCISATACTAVGSYVTSGYGLNRTLIESWNGATWSIVPSPNNANFIHDYLTGVSCISASACTAVGVVSNFNGTSTLIESWNGASWSIVASPGGSGLSGVSCLSASACTAVGVTHRTFGGDTTLVESWNGSTWSIVASPNNGQSSLSGVSCTSASVCTAVGYHLNTTNVRQTLVESWNGTSWSIVASPNNGTSDNSVSGVSCVSASACTAVGSYVNTSSVRRTLIQSWNGTAWSIVASPNNGTKDNSFSRVSCVSASVCTAVGSYANSNDLDRTLVESSA